MTFHDLAGWLMMPLGLGLLWIELKVLGGLLVVTERSRARPPLFVVPSLVASYGSKNKARKRQRRRFA
jgi:hypothetical protein